MNFKRVFCRHIWKLEERKSLYFTNSKVYGIVYSQTEHYAVKFVCLKCNKEKWNERETDITYGK